MQDRFTYPAVFTTEERAEDGFVVSFPDLPEALTGGRTFEEALAMAEDCLAEAIAGRIATGKEIPTPSVVGASHPIPLCAQIALKAALYLAMREAAISKLGLAQRLQVDEREVRRMLDPHHGTKLPTMEKALRSLGKRIHLEVA